jgi:hypothetical protein
MKAITGYLIGAVLMAIVGAVCLATGLLDRAIAHAQEHVVSADYGEPQQIFQSVERYYEYASRLPWIGNGPLNDIRARRAALDYWQGRYVAIVPELNDPVANIPPDNLDLQFLVANAMYREGLAQAKDKPTALATLDAVANAYLTVLRNATRHDDASYNYEYVVKLRNDVDKGRKVVPKPVPPTPGGNRGSRPDEADEAKFKVWVPLDTSEIPAKAGKDDAPIKKKG